MKAFLRKMWRFGPKTTLLVLMVVAFVVGYLVRGGGSTQTPSPGESGVEETKAQVWTCSMHPQIRLPEPGQCPICGMDLIPVSSGEAGGGEGSRELSLSPTAVKLAEIQVAPVERKFVEARVRMVGKVEYDETRLAYITAWVPGRLDRLYVDYTGIPVRKGDHMVYLYSPELLAAQEELIQSLKAVKDLERSGIADMKETALWTVDAVRDKLRLWGLTKDQIDEIEKRGKPTDHMTVYAPMSGIVIHKNAFEGMYVDTGTRIYTIADLSQVWVKLDAYESDLAWIRYGQEVEFETVAYPGETFKGKIAFIDPVLDAKTRTVKVRVNVPNDAGKLKPEMFVRAIVRANVAAGGKVMDPDLAGKWMCPMHPDVVKDGAASCDICGMPLVHAESLGYVAVDANEKDAPLVIPATAPLITGERAVVYVAVPGKEGTYAGREVVLGPRAGDYYLVREGLAEGELVVVNGNFKIDSAVQILAKPSMMSPEGGAPAPGHHDHGAAQTTPQTTGAGETDRFEVPETFKRRMEGLLSAYFEVQQALSQDKFAEAQNAAKNVVKALDDVDMTLLKGPAHMAWMNEEKSIEQSAGGLATAKDIAKAREAFALLSESVAVAAKKFGTTGEQPVLRFHCPMAFGGRGADWLQNKEGTENPYFGAAMFKCGTKTETIVPGHPSEGSHT
jgi:Cu(I)/Ag(I) efflux system membrane fusion protein